MRMNKKSIGHTPAKRTRSKVTPRLRELYQEAKRQASGEEDPDAPILPPEKWANGVVGKFYRPMKTVVSMRVDNDVLAWLKSKGSGHLTRINDILRQAMLTDQKRSQDAEKGISDPR